MNRKKNTVPAVKKEQGGRQSAPSGKPKTLVELEAEVRREGGLLRQNPKDLKRRQHCFALHCQLGNLTAARELLDNCEDKGFLHGSWKTLAQLWRKRQMHAEAAQCFENAFTLNAGDISSGVSAAASWRLAGRLDTALQIVNRVLQQAPEESAAKVVQAEIQAETGDNSAAIEGFEQVLSTGSMGNAAFFKWVELMLAEHRGDELEKRLVTLLSNNPERHQLWAALSVATLHRGDVDQAEQAAAKAVDLAPDNARYLFDFASTKRIAGKIEEAHALLERGLQLQPDSPMALRVFGVEHKYVSGDAALSRLNKAMAGLVDHSPKQRANLMYAMAKAQEDLGDLEAAFAYYAHGGIEKKKGTPYDERSPAYLAQVMVRLFRHGNIVESGPDAGFHSRKPVFVVGMPRSGTSLLEQVLASHPDVDGVGEQKLISRLLHGAIFGGKVRLDLDIHGLYPLDQAVSLAERGRRYVTEVEKIANPTAARIVDKMPGNHMFVGPILMMLPDAYIIHSRRNPVEICLSNYRLLFTEGQLWSYDLRELGRAYRRYHDLMQHWSALYGDRILSVRYEDMVSDLETEAKRIVAHLDLPWNDACLHFYQANRPMKTASASQVRKPIYTTSTNRWRKYEPYLKPLLEELGPLVRQYEEELAETRQKF